MTIIYIYVCVVHSCPLYMDVKLYGFTHCCNLEPGNCGGKGPKILAARSSDPGRNATNIQKLQEATSQYQNFYVLQPKVLETCQERPRSQSHLHHASPPFLTLCNIINSRV